MGRDCIHSVAGVPRCRAQPWKLASLIEGGGIVFFPSLKELTPL